LDHKSDKAFSRAWIHPWPDQKDEQAIGKVREEREHGPYGNQSNNGKIVNLECSARHSHKIIVKKTIPNCQKFGGLKIAD
jgi:hypothetical protein